ncbi:hypothetical protein DPX16_4902 [Anabarilius grahami]|uniref:Uncharacterized protein n=1 Tax=Anabarilius grahami TaxID=495550 RepID=A0A3N0XTV5_ANAGA|nr:hypothetical protein DPX16_4902 [Anabarilius grahami]
MYTPAFLLICLEQKDRSLEAHLDDFLFLAPATHFPDSSLCNFLYAGLNTATKAQLSRPRGSFPEHVEWCPARNLQSAWKFSTTPDLITGDREPASTAMQEPATSGTTEHNIAAELEHSVSDQVCEFAATSIAEGVSEEDEGLEWSPAHTPATESEFQACTNDCDFEFGEDSLPPLIVSETVCSILDELVPPSLPLPPPLQTSIQDFLFFSPSVHQPFLQPSTMPATQPLLSPITSSALHQPPPSGVATSGACCEPASGDEDPAAPPPASDPVVIPRLIVLTPPPLLLPPSSTSETIKLSAPLDSLGPSTSPGSDIAITSPRTYGSFEALRPSTPTAPIDSAFPQAPSRPSVIPAPPQPSSTLLPPRGAVAATPSRTPRPSASLRSFGSLSSPKAPPPSAALLPRVPKVAWRCSPPRLLPPATPPWVGLHHHLHLPGLHHHLHHPGFNHLLHLPGFHPTLALSRIFASLRNLLPSHGARTRLSGRGRNVTCALCFGLVLDLWCSISRH